MPERLGKYELLGVLGQGAMGVVRRARDTQLGRDVAVKVLRQGLTDKVALERFRRESQNAARLRHPGIVTIYEAGQDDDLHWFAMELVEGRSLEALIADRSVPMRRLVAVVERAARAVQYAHEQGVIHRDLKPTNIVVDARDEPHILDFGLSRGSEAGVGLTQSGISIGTPLYMPPEQVLGRPRDIDAAIAARPDYALPYLERGRLRLARDDRARMQVRMTNDKFGRTAGDAAARAAALDDLRRAVRLGVDAEDMELAEATIAVSDERSDAGDRCEAVLARARRKDAAYKLRGDHRWRRDDREGAELDYLQSLRFRPKHDEAWYMLGVRWREAGRLAEAEEALRRCVDINPGFAEAHLSLATTLGALGRFDEAVRMCDAVLARWPDLASAEVAAGIALGWAGRLDAALARFERAHRIGPSDVLVLNNIAVTHERAGRLDRAAEWYGRLIEAAPVARSHVLRALLHRRRGDEAAAEADFEAALRIAPDDLEAQLELGKMRSDAGRLDEAREILRRAVDRHPASAAARTAYGIALGRAKEYGRALAEFDEAIRRDPRGASAWANRGATHLGLGDAEQARSDLTRALELAPEDAHPRYLRGLAWVKLGRRDLALEDFDAVVAGGSSLREKAAQAAADLRRE